MTAETATFISIGGAFDSVLETAGREKKFIPMFPLPFFLFSPSPSPLPLWGKGEGTGVKGTGVRGRGGEAYKSLFGE